MALANLALANLALAWLALLALRIAFLARHWNDFGALWADYARRGLSFQFARVLDYATLSLFGAASVWALWGVNAQTPDLTGRVFLAWLGFLLLERLPVHRFPRTNVPGGVQEALVSLLANVLVASVGAAAVTGLSTLFLRWRG